MEMEEEEEIVITLQDIAEVAMTEAGKQVAGCQREEDDNQLDSDLSKVTIFLLFQNLNEVYIL